MVCLIYNWIRFNSLTMGYQAEQKSTIRYRGFLLLEQHDNTWLVRPERSPMLLLPFRTRICSIREVRKILDSKLAKEEIRKVA